MRSSTYAQTTRRARKALVVQDRDLAALLVANDMAVFCCGKTWRAEPSGKPVNVCCKKCTWYEFAALEPTCPNCYVCGPCGWGFSRLQFGGATSVFPALKHPGQSFRVYSTYTTP